MRALQLDYAGRILMKYTVNWDVQIAGMIFQTGSRAWNRYVSDQTGTVSVATDPDLFPAYGN